MSAPINNGGPAFPAATCGDWQIGMSLRDHFAGQALQGFLAALTSEESAVFGEYNHVAATAYSYADAMIAAREAAK